MKFTGAGVLVFSTDEILGMKKDETSTLETVDQAKWKDYKLIQTGKLIMYGWNDDQPATNLTWNTPDTTLALETWLKTTKISMDRTNISRLHEELQKSQRLMENNDSPGYVGNMSKSSLHGVLTWIAITAACTAVIGLVAVISEKNCRKSPRKFFS